MSVRKVRNSGGNIIGKFPSLKMKRSIQYESSLERDYLYMLDYEAEVSHFEEQPLVIEYLCGNKLVHYTPDMRVVKGGHNFLIECKPLALTGTEENQQKFRAAHAFCVEREWHFQVVSDQDIRSGYRLSNIKQLRTCACHVVKPEIKGWIYALLQRASAALTIEHILATGAFPIAQVWVSVLHMAYHHEIHLPIDEAPLSFHMPVCLGREMS